MGIIGQWLATIVTILAGTLDHFRTSKWREIGFLGEGGDIVNAPLPAERIEAILRLNVKAVQGLQGHVLRSDRNVLNRTIRAPLNRITERRTNTTQWVCRVVTGV